MLSFSRKISTVVCASALALGVAAPTAAAAEPEITWEDCPAQVNLDGAECGRIEVPTYYDNPAAGTISVGFVRVPAAQPDARRGALFTNPGGPGGDAYSWAGNDTVEWPEEIRNEWDLIGVQPRGLPGSTPVDCAATPNFNPIEATTQIGKATRDACEQNTPGYTNSLTTANTAQDWEMVRQALGEDVIDIAGISYGTYLGSAYATQYPQHTGKVLLDSGMSPQLAWNGIFTSQQQGYENALHDLFQFIADNDATYHLGSTPLQVYEKWSQKVAMETGARPTVLPPDAKIGDLPPGLEFAGQPGADIMTATGELRVQAEFLANKALNPQADQRASITLGKTREVVPMPAHWDEFAKYLNGSKPLEVVDDPELARAVQQQTIQMMNMQNLIVCNENTVAGNPWLFPTYLWSNFVTGDIFSLVNSMYGSGAGCGGRGPVTGGAPLDGSHLDTKPLQIQGTGDPQTPYQYHEALSQPMQSSRIVTVHGPGHGHFALGNKAVDEIGVHYLRTGEVTTADAPGLI